MFFLLYLVIIGHICEELHTQTHTEALNTHTCSSWCQLSRQQHQCSWSFYSFWISGCPGNAVLIYLTDKVSRAKKTIIIRKARTYFRKYFECFHRHRPSTGLVQQNEKVVLVVALQHHVTWCNINQSASACIRRWFCSDLQQDLLLESTTSQSLKSKVLHKALQTCGIEQIFFCCLIKMLAFLSHPCWNETCGDGFSFPSRSVQLPVGVLESSWIIMSVRQ